MAVDLLAERDRFCVDPKRDIARPAGRGLTIVDDQIWIRGFSQARSSARGRRIAGQVISTIGGTLVGWAFVHGMDSCPPLLLTFGCRDRVQESRSGAQAVEEFGDCQVDDVL